MNKYIHLVDTSVCGVLPRVCESDPLSDTDDYYLHEYKELPFFFKGCEWNREDGPGILLDTQRVHLPTWFLFRS